jgi:tetratricopeptide (TPR) repeat protein
LDPGDAEAYNSRGNAYNDKGDYNRAILDFNKAIDMSPNSAIFYYNRAEAFRKKDDFGNAITDYSTYLRMMPEDGDGYFYRGYCYSKIGNNTQALSDFRMARIYSPTSQRDKNTLEIFFSSLEEDNVASTAKFTSCPRCNSRVGATVYQCKCHTIYCEVCAGSAMFSSTGTECPVCHNEYADPLGETE